MRVTDFLLLYGFWLLLVSRLQAHDLLLGLAACAAGAWAVAVVKAQDLAPLRVRPAWLALFWAEPWYALRGCAALARALGRRLSGRPGRSGFRAAAFEGASRGPEAAARRALTVMLLTLPPNSIVIDFDLRRSRLLVHQIEPGPLPAAARRLGVRP